MFRELRYGVALYVFAIAGCVAGWLCGNPPGVISGDRDAMNREAAVFAIFGAIVASGAWLFFKYNVLAKPKR